MTIKTAALAATVCALSASGAHAATTYIFDLSREGSDDTPLATNSFSIDSTRPGEETLTGTFTGLYVEDLVSSDDEVTGGDFQSAEEIDRFNNGAGVCRSAECFTTDEPHTVDGATEGVSDYIEMAFSIGGELVDVTLSGLTFGWIGEWTYLDETYGFEGTDGAYEIILDTLDGLGDLGIGIGDTVAVSDSVTPEDNFNSRGSVDLTGETLVDSIFGIKAGDGGSWKLLTVTVEYDGIPPPPPPPPEVPLPGAVWLLLGALGGLGVLGRRSRSSA